LHLGELPTERSILLLEAAERIGITRLRERRSGRQQGRQTDGQHVLGPVDWGMGV
jgi:hypothetical protein